MAQTGTRVDPFRNFNFLVEIDGIAPARTPDEHNHKDNETIFQARLLFRRVDRLVVAVAPVGRVPLLLRAAARRARGSASGVGIGARAELRGPR